MLAGVADHRPEDNPLIYRDVLAERRRLHSGAPWQLTGVVICGAWSPAAQGIGPPSVRAIEAGLVDLVQLPTFMAPDDQSAVELAISEAERAGCGNAEPGRWPAGDHEITTEII